MKRNRFFLAAASAAIALATSGAMAQAQPSAEPVPEPPTVSAPSQPAEPESGRQAGPIDENDQLSPLSLSWDDPDSFPVNGNPGAGNTYWTQMKPGLGSKLCRTENIIFSRCDVTDKASTAITINPGSVSNRVTWSMNYSPNEGYFSQIHIDFFVLNHGVIVGRGTTNDLGSYAGSMTVYNDIDLHGKEMEVAAQVWAMTADGEWIWDGAKTGVAKCDAISVDPNGEPNNICRYIN